MSGEIDSINVVIYSYKEENVIETIKGLLDTRSGKTFIFIHLHDQNEYERSQEMIDVIKGCSLVNGAYFYIPPLSQDGAVGYRTRRLEATVGGKYHLTISPGTIMFKDWDTSLIDLVKNKRAVVSGYYNNMVDTDFLFGNVKMLKESQISGLYFPSWLKYHGEDEILTFQYFKDKIEILPVPDDIAKINKEKQIESDPNVPFSIYHNYNRVVDFFKNGENEYIGKVDKEILDKFNSIYNFDQMRKVEFYNDQFDSDEDLLKLDSLLGSRFIKEVDENGNLKND